MSGRQIGTLVGAAIGTFFGQPQLGASIGGTVGGLLMPDEVGIQDQEGPRLTEAKLTSTMYGKSIERIFGSYRIGGNTIWAKPIRETKHVTEEEVGKGGSETYDVITYSYDVSFAVAFCEGPIDSINKIWADSVKIYDVDLGGYTQAFLSSEESQGAIQIYLGTPDQGPDWVIQASQPDTPAYRNIAYIRFNNFQLEKFGERMPNITCEVNKGNVSEKTIAYQNRVAPLIDRSEVIITNNTNTFFQMRHHSSSDFDYLYCYERLNENSSAEKFNTLQANRIVIDYVWGDRNFALLQSSSGTYNTNLIFDDSKQINIFHKYSLVSGYAFNLLNNILYVIPTDANALSASIDFHIYSYDLSIQTLLGTGTDPIMDFLNDVPYLENPYSDVYTVHMFDGKIFYLTTTGSNVDGIMYIHDLYTKQFIEQIIIPEAVELQKFGTNRGTKVSIDRDKYYYNASGGLLETDKDGNVLRNLSNIEGNSIIYSGNSYFVKNGMVKSLKTNTVGSSTDDSVYYTAFNLNSGASVTLKSIVEELSIASNIDAIELDLDEGNSKIITGFSVPNVSEARSAISVLQSIYLFDLFEEDFKLKIKLRGSSPSKTVSSFILDMEKDKFEASRILDTELPKKITLKYVNSERDYLSGSQIALRIEGNSDNNAIIEAPISLTDTEAKQLVEKLLFSSWSGNMRMAFSIPMDTQLSLCDVITVQYDNISYIVRVTKIVINSDYIYDCEATTENANSYVSNAIGSDTSEGFTSSISDKAGPTVFNVFNAPTLDNTIINSLGVYIAGTGQVLDLWKGCGVFKSKDEGLTYSSQGAIINPIQIGIATDILPTGPTTVWDLDNTVNIMLSSDDTLPSVSDSVLMSTPKENFVLIGQEVLQYGLATLELDGSFTLSRLIRGRRGTEWAVDQHIADEDFVVLKYDVVFSPSTLNIERYYKAVTFGYSLEDSISKVQTCDGTSLKPFAPSYIQIVLETNGDRTISWTRRDRYLSGGFNTLPNSELQEKYKIEFLDGVTIKRTEEVIDATTFVYLSTDYIADLPIDRIKVSQYSDNLLAYGYATEELI